MRRGQNAISESFTGKMMTEQTDGVDELQLVMWEPFGCLGQRTQEGEWIGKLRKQKLKNKFCF